MTPATMEAPVETSVLSESVNLFCDAIEAVERLEIEGTSMKEDGEVFVVRDHSIEDGVMGAHVEVSVEEIGVQIVGYDAEKKAQEFISVILNERGAIVLNGITRVVGYYSRVNNWNKSKVGELRDRAKGTYWTEAHDTMNQAERMRAIDNL